MEAAAEIIASEARKLASTWSVQIPPDIRVTAKINQAVISSGVGPSYPNSVAGVRHPVYGPTLRNPHPAWVTNAYRPYLQPACDLKADAAAREISLSVDDLCHRLGYK